MGGHHAGMVIEHIVLIIQHHFQVIGTEEPVPAGPSVGEIGQVIDAAWQQHEEHQAEAAVFQERFQLYQAAFYAIPCVPDFLHLPVALCQSVIEPVYLVCNSVHNSARQNIISLDIFRIFWYDISRNIYQIFLLRVRHGCNRVGLFFVIGNSSIPVLLPFRYDVEHRRF